MSLIKKIIFYIFIMVFSLHYFSYSSSSSIVKEEETTILVEESVEITDQVEESEETTVAIEDSSIKNLKYDLKVGDEVEFGNFYDLNDEDEIVKMPIKWIVLDRMEEYALLITKDIIKTMPYNYSWSPTNWKESNVRTFR